MTAEADRIDLAERAGGVELAVKVVPGSSRTRVTGVWNTALRVAVSAPAEAGKANRELLRLLADALGTSQSDITILQGHRRPLKRVRIAGLTARQARSALAAMLARRQ